ncbi:protein kinase family protein [Acidiphilium acidophilum]|uniref:Uncharacterized protein n=1 Tax=Acidiphilium acidophilum TaxID=76588 RepID=A0AAW9DRQ4_ACIAO|nr:hypothetical protein [Acidiphilium acidophilum]MDX5931841.1 hypothetical protein [Acidiphilium acidophilum]
MSDRKKGVVPDAIKIIRQNSPSMPSDLETLLDKIEGSTENGKELRDIIEKLADADPDRAVRLLRACYEAGRLCDGFKHMVAAEKAMPQRLQDLRDALKLIDHFIVETDAPPSHPLAARVALEPGEADYLRTAISRIAGMVEARGRIAAQTPTRLGATRTAKTDNAEYTAAIGWLAEAVERITGRPHLAKTAHLAELLFPDEVDIGRVRHARRTRNRDWRGI